MSVLTVEFLEKNNLILVNKSALMDLVADVNRRTSVELKHKWLDRKTIVSKYQVTSSWLKKWENKTEYPYSKLRIKKGKGKTCKITYNEQSVIDELERQASE